MYDVKPGVIMKHSPDEIISKLPSGRVAKVFPIFAAL